MEEDEELGLPTKRAATGDHAARVYADLANHTAAARQYHEQQQAVTTSNVPTRRECEFPRTMKKLRDFDFLAESTRLYEEPIGEEQQALLAEFERRRRVSSSIFSSSFIFD